MNQEITKIIDQYLNGDLSQADREAFEQRMNANDDLRKEVELQRSIMEAVERNATRKDVQRAGKKYSYKKWLKWGSIGIIVAGALVASYLLLNENIGDGLEKRNESSAWSELQNQLDAIDEKAELERTLIQYFDIPSNGATVLSKDGVLLSIPEEAFMKNGQPYTGSVVVQYQEAIHANDIMKAGLSTMAGDKLLETQGMFTVKGFDNEGNELTINPKVGVYVQVPVDDYKEGMELFAGAKDADGNVDWQNPTPLEKQPVRMPMSQLNFYPSDYEPTLNQIGYSSDKEKRDSLYLTFEKLEREDWYWGVKNGIPSRRITLAEREYLYGDNRAVDYVMTDEEAWKLSKWKSNPNYSDFNGMKECGCINYFMEAEAVSDSGSRYTVKADTTNISEFEVAADASSEAVLDEAYNLCFIRPSTVLTIWNDKFNGTKLATRDFEKRMKAIHNTCDQAVLEKYISTLNQPFWKIDEEVAAMGYREFNDFAAERVGKVSISNKHQKQLEKFYQRSVENMQQYAKRIKDKEERNAKKWDESVAQARNQEQIRTFSRDAKLLQEETNYNLENVAKQLGKTVGVTLTNQTTTAGDTPAVWNIDRYVIEATANRSSLDMKDPITGKQVKLTYNDFKFSVANAEAYDKLFAYLVPNRLSSFHRVNPTNGVFNFPLNDDMIYDLVVLGINDEGYHYHRELSIKSGAFDKVELESITEDRLNKTLKQLKTNNKDLKQEWDWLKKERKDLKVQQERKEMKEFRQTVAKSISPCIHVIDEVATEENVEVIEVESVH